jgi:hypothetical protein
MYNIQELLTWIKREMESPMALAKKVFVLFITLVLAVGIAANASAATKKKVTFEQAWKLCKAELDREKIPNTTGHANERYIRGGACMKRYGYSL